jgi:membrane-associated phospholipid phosphatase
MCNWISSQRDDIYLLYFQKELMVPFIPEFFWIYMSMYLLFFAPPLFLNVPQLRLLGKRIIAGTLISGVIFLLFPSQLGFERVVPDGFYGKLYTQIFALDLPYNMAPSLHVVYSGFILFSIYSASDKKYIRISAILWLLLILLSTLLVHQHHIIDIVLALVIIWAVNTKIIKGE